MGSTRARTQQEENVEVEAEIPKSVQAPEKTYLEMSRVQPRLREPSENDSWSDPGTAKMKTDWNAGTKRTGPHEPQGTSYDSPSKTLASEDGKRRNRWCHDETPRSPPPRISVVYMCLTVETIVARV
ncbi:hypothetical protein NDU88_002838 [Pleurodeles waltl]|uniref:Uncharacterized protein n=1 Tax=Pleurodeles waltl TaxID=8319 RepID=A0AAV7QAH4_PLEWA|nr:hypothetical protein NDU88_002838 [Pleurodeles waltl]